MTRLTCRQLHNGYWYLTSVYFTHLLIYAGQFRYGNVAIRLYVYFAKIFLQHHTCVQTASNESLLILFKVIIDIFWHTTHLIFLTIQTHSRIWLIYTYCDIHTPKLSRITGVQPIIDKCSTQTVVLPTGFEPVLKPREGFMIGHYTTGADKWMIATSLIKVSRECLAFITLHCSSGRIGGILLWADIITILLISRIFSMGTPEKEDIYLSLTSHSNPYKTLSSFS